MSRALKSLILQKEFKIIGLPRGSPKINHFPFEDDMIILCKAELGTMKAVVDTLERYEIVSGQKVNKDNSAIYLHKGVYQDIIIMAEVALGILRKDFPFTYLRCPIFHMKKNKLFYQTLMNKVSSKLQGWKGKILSYGATAIHIKHVLQSIPIHYLSVMNPPLNVMTAIQKMVDQFFRSSHIGGKNRHWVRWNFLCLPEDEGGLSFRRIQDVSMALFCKLWWNFRTKSSIWSTYMHKQE